MISKRSIAVLTLGLLLAQGSIPTASAYSQRDSGRPVSSSLIRPVRPMPDKEIPIPELYDVPDAPDTIPYFIHTVDDGDRNFRTKGRWTTVPFAGWKSDFRFASPQRNGQKTAVAEWKFEKLLPGTYEVLATWDSFPGLATDAKFDVKSEVVSSRTFVDQTKPPHGEFLLGRTWQSLGRVEVQRKGTVHVELNNQANSYVVADGIALRRASTPHREADLTLSVSYDDRTRPGESVMYKMFLTNMGPAMAEGARVIIPVVNPNMKFDPANSSLGCVVTEDGSFLDCDFGNMDPRSETRKKVSFTVFDSTECNQGLYNEFKAMSETPDHHQNNNHMDTKVFVECEQRDEADLSLSVNYDDRTVPGGRVKYSVNLTNIGPDTSENTRVILSNFPMWLHFNAEDSDPRCNELASSRPAYEIPGEESAEFAHAILCGFGDMGPQTGTITPMVFDVDRETPCNETFRNLFESDSDTNDPRPYNNSVDSKVLVECDPLPASKITVKEISLVTTATARAGQKNIVLSRIETTAGAAEDILATALMFGEENDPTNLANVQNYTLWVDTDGDSVVDTILQRNVSVSDFSQILFGDLAGGGFVIPSNATTAFEVHGDVKQELKSENIQLTLGTAAPGFIKAEELDTGTPLQGIETDNICAQDHCQILVHTADSTLWYLKQ